MKTTGFRLLQLGTPWRNLSYIVIETDEGISGIGEARVLGKTHTVAEYLKDVERHFIGHDPFDIEALYRRFTLLDFGKPGEVVHTGLAMVEMAFWDIMGKATNQPVYKLLGGKVQDKIQAYANGWYTVERTPGSFSLAASKVVSRGYKALKFDPFGNGDLELSRNELFNKIIKPAVDKGKIVICDRFTDSTLAYQVYGKGVNRKLVDKIHSYILDNFKPNLTYILKVNLNKSFQRMKKRKSMNRYDKFSKKFYNKVQNAFISIAKKNSKRYVVIDNSQDTDQTEKNIYNRLIKKKFNNIKI